MRIDPHLVKRLPRTHLKRILYTACSRGIDRWSKVFFDEYALPLLELEGAPQPPSDVVWSDTQVEAKQMSQLLCSLRLVTDTEGVVVEIGSWRGVTTRLLAEAYLQDRLCYRSLYRRWESRESQDIPGPSCRPVECCPAQNDLRGSGSDLAPRSRRLRFHRCCP